MQKTVLVTGKDTYLGDGISSFFLNQGDKVAVSVTARKEAFPAVEQDERLLVFPWTKRSPISAKNFVLQAVNQLGELTDAFIIFSPEKEAQALADVPVVELEEKIDAHFKGLVFLCRELSAIQAKHPHLAINFVLLDEDYEDQSPISAALYHGFRGLASSLLAASRRRNLPVWGFESQTTQVEDYLAFIINHPRLDAKLGQPGRWHVFGEKKNLFQNMFKTK